MAVVTAGDYAIRMDEVTFADLWAATVVTGSTSIRFEWDPTSYIAFNGAFPVAELLLEIGQSPRVLIETLQLLAPCLQEVSRLAELTLPRKLPRGLEFLVFLRDIEEQSFQKIV